MCGICGIADPDPKGTFDQAAVECMSRALSHRGPDDCGVSVHSLPSADGEGRLALGHRRLSIIDIEGGHQPMANEDETVWVVFNGEIYNFVALRDELASLGHRFRTRCDTEVIVHAYEQYGVECVHRFRGMFAFAVWDATARSLFLARDRLGQKPLHYIAEGRRFAFASEIAALALLPGTPRRLRLASLHDYLTYQYVPHPFTMFEGIMKLPPATALLWKDGELKAWEYWRPPFREVAPISEGEAIERVRHLLEEATRLRLAADVPLGAFLSGGIDSSIVVGLMARLMGAPVKTFSIGFEEEAYNETGYARQVAERFGTEHHEFIVRPDAIEIIPKLIEMFGEPFADSSAIPTYYVSRETRGHVTVALTGDAGDEGFAGYSRYKATRLSRLFDGLPARARRWLGGGMWEAVPVSVEPRTLGRKARRFFQAMALDPESRYARWCCILDDERKLRLYSPEMRERFKDDPSARVFKEEYTEVAGLDFLAQTMFVDYRRYLPDDLNVKVDIASMANSLECRAPFLDHKVVEFAARLPTRLKLRGMTSKYLLKKAFGEMLPRGVRNRPKMGFGVPIAEWFRGELKEYVRGVLLDPESLRQGYFDPDAVRALVDEHTEARCDHGFRLWSLLMFELWRRRFL